MAGVCVWVGVFLCSSVCVRVCMCVFLSCTACHEGPPPSPLPSSVSVSVSVSVCVWGGERRGDALLCRHLYYLLSYACFSLCLCVSVCVSLSLHVRHPSIFFCFVRPSRAARVENRNKEEAADGLPARFSSAHRTANHAHISSERPRRDAVGRVCAGKGEKRKGEEREESAMMQVSVFVCVTILGT